MSPSVNGRVNSGSNGEMAKRLCGFSFLIGRWKRIGDSESAGGKMLAAEL
jgi:hypothetical protein